MLAILNNPYRTVGLLAGAKAKEQERQVRRLKQFIDAEQDPDDDFSFPVFGDLSRTISCVEDASSKLNLDSDKVHAAMFWFWNGNDITDEAAFDSLKQGDVETAFQIWDKLITTTNDEGKRFWKPVTEKNHSAFHNVFVISFLKEKGNLQNAIAGNLYFLESELVHKFISAVSDETYKPSKKDLQLTFLNQLLLEIEKSSRLSVAKFIEIISKQNFSAKDEFVSDFTKKLIEQIEKKIEDAKIKRKEEQASAVLIGTTLHKESFESLKHVKFVHLDSEHKYSFLADKVANEMLQCSIDYFNHHHKNDSQIDYIEPAWKLAKMAETIAVGILTQDRIADSVNTLEELKDKEILEAIQVMQSIKDSYEENREEIEQHVRELEESDIEIKIGLKKINRTAVEDNIRNSIDWSQVVEMFDIVLCNNNLKKIKYSHKDVLKKEFFDLLNWMNDTCPQSSAVTVFINKYKEIPPKLPFKILSAEVTNTDNKPLYIKHIRFISLKINVEVIDNKEVTIYLKYIDPDGSIKRNSKISPSGYTISATQNLNTKNKSIYFPGWGSDDKCTYCVGEHRIEVYIDEYLIHSIRFSVDLSPIEKLEIDLEKAKKQLNVISNTKYYVAELSSAQNELNTIKEWKFLRTTEEREKQISDQLKIISELINKAETRKNALFYMKKMEINEIESKIQNAEY